MYIMTYEQYFNAHVETSYVKQNTFQPLDLSLPLIDVIHSLCRVYFPEIRNVSGSHCFGYQDYCLKDVTPCALVEIYQFLRSAS
jgi:hypothetical protein